MKRLLVILTVLLSLNKVAGAQVAGSAGFPSTTADKKTIATIISWRNNFGSMEASLTRVEPHATPDCRWYVGFRPDTIRSALVIKRDELVANLPDKDQAALRAFIIDEFPVQFAETLTSCVDGSVVLPDSLRESQKRINDFIKSITERESFWLTIDIATTPSGAVFSYFPKYDRDELGQVSTNISDQRVRRGKYRYSVKKDGYLPIEGERSLMDGDRIRVACELVKEPPTTTQPTDAKSPKVPRPTPMPCNFQ